MSKNQCSPSTVQLELETLEDRRVLSTSAFVTGLYQTILHRTPGPSETAGWVAAINAGADPLVVAQAFTTSTEHLDSLVRSEYQNILGRTPSAQEVGGWVTALQNGLTDQQLVGTFLASPEYFQTAGGTNSSWINGVYKTVLNRPADPAGQAAWMQALQNGTSRDGVALTIENSPESIARLITAAYEGVLGRGAEPQAIATWSSALARGMSPSQLEAILATSPEYINARGGLDVVHVVPVPVVVPVFVPVDSFLFDPFFGTIGFPGGFTSPGFTGGSAGGFTCGCSGGFGGGGSGSGS